MRVIRRALATVHGSLPGLIRRASNRVKVIVARRVAGFSIGCRVHVRFLKRFRPARTLQHTVRLENAVVQQSGRAAKSERCEREQHCLERHGAAGRHRLFALQSAQFGGKNGVRRRGKNNVVRIVCIVVSLETSVNNGTRIYHR